MSGSLNRVQLIGNLCADPEIRKTHSGDPIANIRLATNETWKDRNSGEKKEKVEFHNVVIFGGLAGIAEKYLSKGSKIFLEGQLQTRKWKDKDGNDRYSTEVVLQNFGGNLIMLPGKNDGGGRDDDSDRSSNRRSESRQEDRGGGFGGGGFGESLDDTIPFEMAWR